MALMHYAWDAVRCLRKRCADVLLQYFFPSILVAVSIIVVIFSLNHANIVWNYCAERVMDYWF